MSRYTKNRFSQKKLRHFICFKNPWSNFIGRKKLVVERWKNLNIFIHNWHKAAGVDLVSRRKTRVSTKFGWDDSCAFGGCPAQSTTKSGLYCTGTTHTQRRLVPFGARCLFLVQRSAPDWASEAGRGEQCPLCRTAGQKSNSEFTMINKLYRQTPLSRADPCAKKHADRRVQRMPLFFWRCIYIAAELFLFRTARFRNM